jgi:hypothetical protein
VTGPPLFLFSVYGNTFNPAGGAVAVGAGILAFPPEFPSADQIMKNICDPCCFTLLYANYGIFFAYKTDIIDLILHKGHGNLSY